MCADVFFFFKKKTAYELRISDWRSDGSSDLAGADHRAQYLAARQGVEPGVHLVERQDAADEAGEVELSAFRQPHEGGKVAADVRRTEKGARQSLLRLEEGQRRKLERSGGRRHADDEDVDRKSTRLNSSH